MRQSAMAPKKEQFRAVTAVATLQLVTECGGARPHVIADAIIANGNGLVLLCCHMRSLSLNAFIWRLDKQALR